MAFILNNATQTTSANIPVADIRTVSVLSYKTSVLGMTAFYTELDSGIQAGDYVYIIGGGYDNVSRLLDPLSFDLMFTAQDAWKGYRVVSVNPLSNEVVLNIPFDFFKSVNYGPKGFIEVQMCKSTFLSGVFRSGDWQEGTFGLPTASDDKISAYFGPASLNSPLVPVWRQGIWRNGIMSKGDFQSRTDGYTPAKSTVKQSVRQGSLIGVGVGVNNNGVGYNKWLGGQWAPAMRFNNNNNSQATWRNGRFLGGSWTNGIFYGGLMSSEQSKIVWANGEWRAGTAQNIDWLNGNWVNGTWYGATMAIVALAQVNPSRIIVYVDSVYKDFVKEDDLICITTITSSNAVKQAGNIILRVVDLAAAQVDITATYGPNPPYLGIYVDLPPGVTFSSLDVSNAYVGVGRFRGGTWRAGTFIGGMFGYDGSGDEYDPNNLYWNSTEWTTGTFKGGIWMGGVWRNGTMTSDPIYGRSRWVDGNWYNGTFTNSDWEGGVWRTGTANGTSVFSNEGNAQTLWVSGVLDGATFNVAGTNLDMMWKQVDWRQGNWNNLPRPGNQLLGQPYLLTNNNVQEGNGEGYNTQFGLLGGRIDAGGVFLIDAFKTKNVDGFPLDLRFGDIFEMNLYTDGSLLRKIDTVYYRLTSSDLQKLSTANTVDFNIPSTFKPVEKLYIPLSNLPAQTFPSIVVQPSIYRKIPAPANYVSDVKLDLALRADGSSTFLDGESAQTRIAQTRYTLYLKITPLNAAQNPIYTEKNLATLTSSYSSNARNGTSTGQVYPGAATSPATWPTVSAGSVLVGTSLYVPVTEYEGSNGSILIGTFMGEEERLGGRTRIPVKLDMARAGKIAASVSVRVRLYPGYTTTITPTASWYGTFDGTPIFVPVEVFE